MSSLTIKRGSTETLFKRSRKSGQKEATDLAQLATSQDTGHTFIQDKASANLFANLPNSPQADEQFSDLLKRPGLRIERIVSTGQASPDGFWYDQDEAEWVLVLQGKAGIRFEDEATTRSLKAGDYLDIASHRRHRVEWTAEDQVTVWLAVFYPASTT